MFFLIHYARVVHALRRFLSRVGVLERLNQRAAASRWSLWGRSLLSVLDFDDFVTLDAPWWTIEAGKQVREFLLSRPHSRVLEWGSGASTVWLGALAGSVVSIESDPHWATRVSKSIGRHVSLLTPEIPQGHDRHSVRSKRWGFRDLDFRHYVDAIDTVDGLFDLIVIDGRAREACFAKALSRLAPDGIMVFDNTNRRRYRRALRSAGRAITIDRYVGLTPIVPWPTETSLIRRASASPYAATGVARRSAPTRSA